MWKNMYDALYRFILIEHIVKEGILKTEKERFTDKENWEITKHNISYGYKGKQVKKYIQEDWIIHNNCINRVIRNYTYKANIAKAIQLNNRLFVEAIEPYKEGKLSENMCLDGETKEIYN